MGGTCTPITWGHGYASEAGYAGLSHALGAALPRVPAVTAPGNVASQKVCCRLGMRHLGQTYTYYNATHEVYEARRAGLCRGHLLLDSALHT